jgi:hypothetical protein
MRYHSLPLLSLRDPARRFGGATSARWSNTAIFVDVDMGRGHCHDGVLCDGEQEPVVHRRLRYRMRMGSVYGFLQGAWPFGIVEAVWKFVALRRWNAVRVQ